MLGWLAGADDDDPLGSGIFQMPARTPAMTAMTAATLDQLSGGRMLLGLGIGGPQVVEGWHGQRFAKQLQRTREYVEIVRKALARERLDYDGETLKLPLPGGPGKALKLTIAPVQERIPIYLAAIGPKNTALAAEIADGWLPTLFAPEHVAGFGRCSRRAPRARAARSRASTSRRPSRLAITDDVEPRATSCARSSPSTSAAWARASRTSTTSSSPATASRTRRARSRTSTSSGKQDEAMAAIPDELIDKVALCGPRDASASACAPTATRASARSASPRWP